MVQALENGIESQQDIPQAIQLLGEMNTNTKHIADLVEGILQRVKNGELSTEYGLSFLEVKYHMLLNYLINLTYVVLRKCSGETVHENPAIDRLIEIRTVLEKIRPIETKLRYQVDKLVKVATTGMLTENDPLLYKPNPDNMMTDNIERNDTDEENDDDESEIESDTADEDGESEKKVKNHKSAGTQKYVPPRIRPMYFDEDESPAKREAKQMEQLKKRAITASMLQDLKEEYLDAPTEISSGSRAQNIIAAEQKEKQEYEETYLTRLPVTKAEKHRQRKLTTLATLGDDLLSEIGHKTMLQTAKKKRKLKGKTKGKGKKRGGKKRKMH